VFGRACVRQVEVIVLAVQKERRCRLYRIITPFVLEDGARIMVGSPGFAVGQRARTPATLQYGPQPSRAILQMAAGTDSSRPEATWKGATSVVLPRCAKPMAQNLGTQPVLLVTTRASDPAGSGDQPLAVDTARFNDPCNMRSLGSLPCRLIGGMSLMSFLRRRDPKTELTNPMLCLYRVFASSVLCV